MSSGDDWSRVGAESSITKGHSLVRETVPCDEELPGQLTLPEGFRSYVFARDLDNVRMWQA
jgi:hypothetical protein